MRMPLFFLILALLLLHLAHATTCQGDHCPNGLIISGGLTNLTKTSIEIFPAEANCANTIPPFPQPGRRFHSLSVVDNGRQLVACGGIDTKQSCISWRSGQDEWTEYATLSHSWYFHAAVVRPNGTTSPDSDVIFLIGGPTYYMRRSVAKVELDTAIGGLKHDSEGTCAVNTAYNQSGFITTGGWGSSALGNWGGSKPEDGVHGKVNRYGKNSGSLPDLVTPRQHHGCSSFLTDQGEEAILVAGGSVEGSEGWIPISSTELFLPSTNRWTEVGSLPRGLIYPRAAQLNQRMVVTGGWDGNSTRDEVLQYNLETGTWSQIGKMKEGRAGHAIVEVNLQQLGLACAAVENVTTIISVTPHQLQRTTARTLQLVIDNMPDLPGNYICAFSALGKVLMTNATRTSKEGVYCTTPRNDLLPNIPSGESHFTSKLSLRVEEDGQDFVSTNFTFFDCNAFSSCTTCVSSTFPCDWCVDGHRCTHDTAENCRNDILVSGINQLGPRIRSGPAFCPRVSVATLEGSSEILVPSGFQKSIQVKVDHTPQFIIQTRFVCQFNIEGRVTSVNAQLVDDTIYCDEMEFSYTSRAPNVTSTVAVIWGQSKPLDNPENIHVVIYQCKEMANNCGKCLSLDEKYQCGWCQATEQCEVNTQCGASDEEEVSWMNRNETCPNHLRDLGQVAILVRKRVGNPSDYFDKTFAEYEEGFESKGESWLGLKKLHQLTSESSGSLRITLKDFDNNTYVAFYDQFQVGSAADGYVLTVGEFNDTLSTLGNSMYHNNGKKFTTKDRDQDRSSKNCAQLHTGAWWFGSCTGAYLTGMHTETRSTIGGNKQLFYYDGGERGNTKDSWAEAEMLLLPN